MAVCENPDVPEQGHRKTGGIYKVALTPVPFITMYSTDVRTGFMRMHGN